MRLLIFPLTFIWALIRINPAKTIMIGVALWMFSYAGTIPDTKHEIKFFHQFELKLAATFQLLQGLKFHL